MGPEGQDVFVRGMLIRPIEALETRTIFIRYGEWLAWFCSFCSLALMFVAFAKRPR
jgi:hypothetical protein